MTGKEYRTITDVKGTTGLFEYKTEPVAFGEIVQPYDSQMEPSRTGKFSTLQTISSDCPSFRRNCKD